MKKIYKLFVIVFVLMVLASCFNNGSTDKYYKVTFIGFDDVILKEEEVKENGSATPPEAPLVSGYEFIKWDKAFTNINEETIIKAIYNEQTLKTFSVVFLSETGVILKIESVTEGFSANAPIAPTIEGYTFVGWDLDFSNVISDMNIKPIYEQTVYTVTFLDINEEVIKIEEVAHKESATYIEGPEVSGYLFIGWDKDFDEVTENLIIKAIYEKKIKMFTVTFLNNLNNIIKTSEVEEGKSAIAPTAPVVIGYTFIGWDQDYTNVNSNLTIKPIYEIKTYTVKFMSHEELIDEVIVNYGDEVIAPIVEKPGYLFIGWDEDTTKVTRNLTVNAVWQKIIHASFLNEFTFIDHTSISSLLENLENESNLYYTITNVKYGGSRLTDEIVYYDQSLTHNTNIYGLEVAINQDGLVIEKATKVSIPNGGFVLSGHGAGLTLLDNQIKLGDYITYKNNEAKIYRNNQTSNIISLAISLNQIRLEIIEANLNHLALDYVEIENIYNEVVDIINELINNYTFKDYSLAEELLLTIGFMLIEPQAATVRAMWHYPLRSSGYSETSTFEVRRFLDKVKSIGINRIYLNTNFNGGSIYESNYLTQRLTAHLTYEGYKDYLEAFISEAHLRGIEVYAWTNTLIAGDGMNNNYYSSRGWILKGFNGEDNHGGMYFLDISNDDVQEFLKNIFKELVTNYDLDGFEYDFIRFPVGRLNTYAGGSTEDLLDWGWTDSFQSKFKEKYNLTGDLKSLVISNSTIRNNWLQFKRDLLTETVEMISTTIKDVKPNIVISAAVMASLSGAKNIYLQDWENWIIEGFVEELNPMIYTADNSGLVQDINSMKIFVQDYADIVVGIYPEGSGGSLKMVSEQIKLVESLGVLGVARFSSRQIFGTALENAFVGMHRNYLVLPTNSSELIFSAYVENIKEKVLGYYINKFNDPNYNDLITVINSFNESLTITEKMATIKTIINLINNETVKNNLLKEHDKIAVYLNK